MVSNDICLTYTIRYESGCLLNSFASINGPPCLGLTFGGAQLACVAALGLNPLSLGAVKENLAGLS